MVKNVTIDTSKMSEEEYEEYLWFQTLVLHPGRRNI